MNLILRRYVVVHNERIFGEDEIGRVVLQNAGGLLHLYCSTESITRKALPWPFICDKLSVFFDIPEERQKLVISILTTPDHDTIKDILEREDLLTDAYDHAGNVQTPPVSEHDIDEELNFEVNGAEGVSQTPDRPSTSTPSSSSVRGSRFPSSAAFGDIRTPSRHGARRVISGHEPQVFNVESVFRAAEACNSDDISVLGLSANESAQVGAENLLRTSISSSGTPIFSRSTGASNFTGRDVNHGSSPNRSPFNMGAIDASLPILDNAEAENSDYPAAGDRQKEIGYGGELYVRTIPRPKHLSDVFLTTPRSTSSCNDYSGPAKLVGQATCDHAMVCRLLQALKVLILTSRYPNKRWLFELPTGS